MGFFTEDLISAIKARSLAPISQSTFSEEDLLALATEELRTTVTSDLIKIREDFFLDDEDVAIEANVANYAIPSRAISNALKEVKFVDSAGNESPPLPRGDSTDSAFYQGGGSQPERFYIQGDEIIVLPKPLTASGSLRFIFPARASELIATSSCAKITVIGSSPTTASFTVNTDLTASLVVGSKIDIQSVQSPFKLWAVGLPITQITDVLIEVDISGVTNINDVIQPQVDDYICPTGFSNIPHIPIEYHLLLAQTVVKTLMQSLGDANKESKAEATVDKMRQALGLMSKNRVESTPQRANRRNKLLNSFR